MPDLADLFPGYASEWINTSAGRIFARVGGKGPPLLLLHGFSSTHVMWHPVAPQLADMLVKVSYDIDQDVDYRVDPIANSRLNDPFYRRGLYDPFGRFYYGRPYYSRYGYYSRYRDPFYYGWGDPFYSGYAGRIDGFNQWGEPVRAYKVYESELDLDIGEDREIRDTQVAQHLSRPFGRCARPSGACRA